MLIGITFCFCLRWLNHIYLTQRKLLHDWYWEGSMYRRKGKLSAVPQDFHFRNVYRTLILWFIITKCSLIQRFLNPKVILKRRFVSTRIDIGLITPKMKYVSWFRKENRSINLSMSQSWRTSGRQWNGALRHSCTVSCSNDIPVHYLMWWWWWNWNRTNSKDEPSEKRTINMIHALCGMISQTDFGGFQTSRASNSDKVGLLHPPIRHPMF